MTPTSLLPRVPWAALAAVLASAQEFDSVVMTSEMVPMRDGVKLATDIYRPARGGQVVDVRFPTLVTRTPYNKSGIGKDIRELARHGFVVVAQDCRGRFASQGSFYAFLNEGKDGYDTIEWAAAQPWSNGKVGTFGGSYVAWNQYHAAMYKPPHLEAMFAIVGGANFYQEYGYPGGAPNLGWPLWILGSARTSQQAAENPEALARISEADKQQAEWLRREPASRRDVFNGFPAHQKMYDDLIAHPNFDAYWKQRGWHTTGYYRDMKDVPALFLTGWYDYFGPGSMRNFAALASSQKTAKKLIVGPWPHSAGAPECGDVWFGEAAGIPVVAYMADWFSYWFKRKPLTLVGPEAVRTFRMGGGDGSRTAQGRFNHSGEWRTSASWPPAAAKGVRYYLHAGGKLNTVAPKESGPPSSYDYDPRNPVPTIGGRYGGGATPRCAQDQVCKPGIPGCRDTKPLTARADVVSFSTEPLTSPVEATGFIRASFRISSDAPDTDFTAKLVDVYPNGYSLIIADGQIRARFRRSFEKPEPLQPGKIYKVTVDLGPASNLFAAGHRIRLDVSSSNFPNIEPNRHKARNSLYHDATRQSYLELPVIR